MHVKRFDVTSMIRLASPFQDHFISDFLTFEAGAVEDELKAFTEQV